VNDPNVQFTCYYPVIHQWPELAEALNLQLEGNDSFAGLLPVGDLICMAVSYGGFN